MANEYRKLMLSEKSWVTLREIQITNYNKLRMANHPQIKFIEKIGQNLIQSALTVAKVLIKSKFGLPKFHAPEKSVVVIANGPSARPFLDQCNTIGIERLKEKGLAFFVLNKFGCQPEFFTLKPTYYLMLDKYFFEFTKEVFENPSLHPFVKQKPTVEKIQRMINETWKDLQKVDWPMVFFVPQLYRNSYIVKNLNNPNITFITYNYTVVKGTENFRNLMYKWRLGSPQCENVVNSCLFNALHSGFENIYLTGVDHDFHINIMVDTDNTINYIESHFYADENKKHPMLKQESDGTTGKIRLQELFQSLVKVHSGYDETARYAKHMNKNIINLTEGGYVDAFERMSLKDFFSRFPEK